MLDMRHPIRTPKSDREIELERQVKDLRRRNRELIAEYSQLVDDLIEQQQAMRMMMGTSWSPLDRIMDADACKWN